MNHIIPYNIVLFPLFFPLPKFFHAADPCRCKQQRNYSLSR